MIVIEYIKDRKGIAGRGSCAACLATSEEDDRMVRIKFYDDESGFQTYRFNLCQKCYKELRDEMLKLEEGVKGCREAIK